MRVVRPHQPEPIQAPYASVYGLLVAIGLADTPYLRPLREPRECVVVTQHNKCAGKDVP